MKVLINALSARRGGSRVFARNLLHALALADPLSEYVVLGTQVFEDHAQLPDNITFMEVPERSLAGFRRLVLEQVQLPLHAAWGGFDHYLQIDDVVPPALYLSRIRTVAVFHASIQFVLPSEIGDSWARRSYWRLLKSLALEHVDVPVTVSYCAKGELARGQEGIFRRLQVIYHGIDHGLFCEDSIPGVREQVHRMPDRYLLSVSTRNPHKNYVRVVEAYQQLVESTGVPEHLVMIGSRVWDKEEERIGECIAASGLQHRIHIWEAVDNAELPEIYRGASAYVYASLYDSFGLTPLEAMACGVPCAVSEFSAIPEICGDAAEYFDPLDISSICQGMKTVLLNGVRRRELIELGRRHVQRFTWHKAARSYLKLLSGEGLPTWSV